MVRVKKQTRRKRREEDRGEGKREREEDKNRESEIVRQTDRQTVSLTASVDEWMAASTTYRRARARASVLRTYVEGVTGKKWPTKCYFHSLRRYSILT